MIVTHLQSIHVSLSAAIIHRNQSDIQIYWNKWILQYYEFQTISRLLLAVIVSSWSHPVPRIVGILCHWHNADTRHVIGLALPPYVKNYVISKVQTIVLLANNWRLQWPHLSAPNPSASAQTVTSNSPMAIEMAEIYRTKNAEFLHFLRLFYKFFAVLTTFWRNFREN